MRPMLAAKAPIDGLDFPLVYSAKLDGIRCVIEGGVAKTRTLELVPNQYVQRMLGHACLEGLDGELICGAPYADDVYRRTLSEIMSVGGKPDFTFYVFDFWNGPEGMTYEQRAAALSEAFSQPLYAGHPHLQLLEQRLATSMEELSLAQEDHLEQGYEGLILRNPRGLYKFGRSTHNREDAVHATSGKPLQPWVMMKLKRFTSGEAVIVGFKEMMHNENDLVDSALGLAKRGHSQDGMVPAGVLGAFIVVDKTISEKPFGLGTGFDAKERELFWNIRDKLLGQYVRYKHFEIGAKDVPRHGVFDGFRHPLDYGELA